ncbi:MAG TPA: hypothetical protein ENI23_16190 [bacterium]|nr:hypothetical protein [bacterium]
MELKVNLPNPYEVDAEQFFAQMRIALKAAEKTYQEAIKGLTEEEMRNFWLGFELTEIEATEQGRKALEEIDPDYELRHAISITINSS